MLRLEALFAPVIVSVNSVRLPPAVPAVPIALLVNAVKLVGAFGTLAVVTLPFTELLGMLNEPFVSAADGVEK